MNILIKLYEVMLLGILISVLFIFAVTALYIIKRVMCK